MILLIQSDGPDAIMPKAKSKSRHGGGLLPIDLIPFVRQSSPGTTLENNAHKHKRSLTTAQDGNRERSFYENILELQEDKGNTSVQPSSSKEHSKSKTKNHLPRNIKTEPKSVNVKSDPAKDYFKMRNDLLSAAESGNLKELQQLVLKGADVNSQDQYGWTALMCASQSGQSSAITYLLDSGAITSIRNAKGQSAWDIATLAKKHKVLHTFTNYGKDNKSVSEQVTITHESFFCEICEEQIEGTERKKHIASTVHQLNVNKPVNDTAYGIPGHNRGFQLMLKSGWNQQEGLGPDGTGQKYPVKTHLKRDRKGLGVEVKKDSKPKVTHFQPFDKKAVEHKHRIERAATLSKRAASKKALKEKEMERKFRMEWNCDL